MAEKFQPQTFDINAINEGDKFTLGDGISPEAVNAPIEAAAYIQSLATNQPNIENIVGVGDPSVSIELAPNGTPRFKFESLQADNSQEIQELQEKIAVLEEDSEFYNTEINELWGQVENHADKIETNKKELHSIKQALLQNEVLVVSKIQNKTTTRVTAGGENIVDEQYTAVTEIKGSTVRCDNLFDVNKRIANREAVTSSNIREDALFTMFYIPVPKNTDITMTIINSVSAFLSLANSLDVGSPCSVIPTLEGSRTINTGDYSYLLFSHRHEGFPAETVEFMVNLGTEAKPYQPYFTDLKHAYIKAIKSTGKNFTPRPYVYSDGEYNGITYTVNKDGSITANGTATNVSFFVVALGVYLPEGDYYISDGANMGFPAHMRWGNENLNTSFYSSGEANDIEIRVETGTVLNNVTFKPMLNRGTAPLPYEPYTEELYELPQELINLYPNGIPEYDRFHPQTGEIVIQTGYATSETGFTEEEIAGYDSAIVSSDNRSLEYKLATPTIEKIENAQKLYKAWNKGSETVVQGETDNSIYGAMPTITNEYILKIGGEE